MRALIPAATKALVGAVAVGALTLGAVGTAGAVSMSPASHPGKHFDCANATKALTRIQKREAAIAAGLPKMSAAEARAQKNGHTERADRLKKRIAHLESPRYRARLAKLSAAIEAKCHVAAPSTTTGASASSVTRA